ncbi:hypothetical protein ID866_10892 [Astraeus odoratus]|nr:hypothetical protein ID866_10892 [Astraeus odoratus]
MSMCKSSMVMGAPVEKSINWTKVSDKELVTNIDDTDSVLPTLVPMLVSAPVLSPTSSAAAEAKKVAAGRFRGPSEQKLGECACIKKRLACGLCAKAKEQCEWLKVEMMVSRARMSPQGREHKKQVKKVGDNNDDDEIVILSGLKTRQQGAGGTLEEISNQRWGELIQAVSTCMDMANGHLERIASMAQSNERKMQWHFLLMEGLVGQQQLLVSRLVKLSGATASEWAKGVAKGQEELKELQGKGSGGQDGETEGVPGGALEGEPEDVPGNELEDDAGAEDGTGAEDGAGEEGQQSKAKGKDKEKAL